MIFMPTNTLSIDKVIKKHFNNLEVDIQLETPLPKRMIKIDDSVCICCNICTEVCPVNAMDARVLNAPRISNKCVYCEMCKEACPVDAINITRIAGKFNDNNIILEESTEYKELIYNQKKCLACMVCLKNCPFCAISKAGPKVKFNMKKCKLCGHCGKLCPPKAIKFKLL
ncbi:4Fe-4S ferredoxin iron-sulfur binding domain protein [Methanococcus aeolicus Nankai-3]|uniref:4Fe-4S ferredoxin iron-sulfur binding domain protein n=2 Tax=Methanococcus aeolicus TaxID=42879 RepID=A6UTY8_META3|nr:4Fe-4S ferredoxin iron-sulfur binding domain protein [Methanococcus aeolicus Nankai-3]